MAVIGIDFGGTSIKGARIQNNKVVAKKSAPTLAKKGKLVVLSQLHAVIDALWKPGVKRIGMGFPAPIVKNKILSIRNVKALQGIDLAKDLKKRYKVPVTLANDANCFTLSSAIKGKGKKYKRVVGLTLGTGLGGGIVIDKKIYEGAMGRAGEINTLPYHKKTIEDYTSAKFFKTDDVYSLAQLAKKNTKVKKQFEQFGKHLAYAVGVCLQTYDPDVIVFGGNISKEFGLFAPAMKKELERLKIKPCPIVRETLVSAAELGAGLL